MSSWERGQPRRRPHLHLHPSRRGGGAGGLELPRVQRRLFQSRAPDGNVGPLGSVCYLSLAKLYDLYVQNPSWFVLNEATAYINQVNASIELEETIDAFYARLDSKFMDNRLWLVVGGVRYERTEDDGRGPLNDIGATYQRDAGGNFIRNPPPNGPLVRITTNALANARLQYKERGVAKKTNYDGLYPSQRESLVLRPHGPAGRLRPHHRPAGAG